MEISNWELKESDVPTAEGDWIKFAYSFNGYSYCGGNEACAELANKTASVFYETGKLPNLSLDELRACLFFEQRRDYWTGGDSEADLNYINSLLNAIRLEVRSNQENITCAKSLLGTARRILVLTGAGISAESGVPTFRGGGDATVWRGMPFEQLSSAQMVNENLPLVWEWFDYRRGLVGGCEPNAAHKVLATVQRAGIFNDFSIVTQNIDGLHQAAGANDVIELHGSIWQTRCLSCKTRQSLREIPEDERPPVCPECFDSMRPDVILFGEAMPMEEVYAAEEKAEQADVCFVIGTSALVYPAAELPLIAKQKGATVIEINPEETGLSSQADISLRGKAAEILPLIFAENDSSNLQLPDEKSIKSSVEQTRKESQAERKDESMATENSNQNEQQSKAGFKSFETHRLRVDFITSDEFPFLQKLGILSVSGEMDWEHDLERGLDFLEKFYQASWIVLLNKNGDLTQDQADGFSGDCFLRGINSIHCSLEYSSVPLSLKEVAGCVGKIVGCLNDEASYDDEYKNIVIYSTSDLALSGVIAACAIVAAGGNSEISASQAIRTIRTARPDAVETAEQERFVSLFGEYWKIYSKSSMDFYRQKGAITEEVLYYGWSGDGVGIFRYKAPDGGWNFYNVFFPIGGGAVSDAAIEYDPDKTPFWNTHLFGSLPEALRAIPEKELIFAAQPAFIHHEYRQEIKNYLENLRADLTDDQIEMLRSLAGSHLVTPESWLEKADKSIRAESDVVNAPEETNDRNSREPSDNHFLLCWKEQSVLAAQSSPHPLDVVSSRQLSRVKAGDTIWIVFVSQDGELVLAGRLKVSEVVDYLTAVRRLHDANLWNGDYYALAEENTAEKINLINLGNRAFELRFKKSNSDRLTATNGKIKAQQLGSMRELTKESAQMLTNIWENAVFDIGGRDDDFDWDNEIDLEPAELLESCRRAVSEQPGSADAHYNLGVALDENDLPDEANEAYQKAIDLDQGYWQAYYNLGQNYLRKGEFNKADDAFIHAALLNHGFAEAHFMLGVVYAAQNKHLESIDATMRGLTYSPNDPKGYFNVGNSYFHLRDYEKAAEWFEKSLEIDQNAPDAFYMLGKCYRYLGSKLKELDAYRQAVELVPDFFDALSAAGTAYAHLTGTPEGEQVSYFEPGNEFSLLDAQVFFYMGLGILALGNIEEARGTQEHLREMDASLAERLQFFIDRFVAEDESENDSKEFDLPWLKPEESGFNIRVLDCRPFTEARVTFATEEQNALTFLSTRDSDGEHHRGKSPENARSFSCELSYPINALIYSRISKRPLETRELPEGKLFAASEMEDKWDVFYFDKYFYFVRSWTDKIAYRACAEEEGLYLNITEIEYDGKASREEDYHLRVVDYLLKTFVIGLTVPHPVPADIENTPESIALSSFSFAGRHAKFASFEDTISAIFDLQAMDYVGPFDKERIREWQEKEQNNAADDGEVKNSRIQFENYENTAATANSAGKAAGSTKRKIIKVVIDGELFEAKNIPELYKMVLQYLVDSGKLENFSVPVATGEKRYILAKEPLHQTGKSFLAPVEYKGFFMEAHNNRAAAIAQLEKLIESIGSNFHHYSLDELAKKVNEHEMDIGQIGTYIYVELEEGNISGVEHFLEEIGEPKMFENWIAEAKQKAKQEEKPKNQDISSIKPNSRLSVFQGCLLGGAIGDALGTTVEFKPTGTFSPVTTLTGGGPFELKAGEWTDDTSMMLCLADSLIESARFDPVDQMHRYCRWKNKGYLSSNGIAFDIGNTVRKALEKFEQQAAEEGGELNAYCGSVSPSTAGNGSLMRLAPVPLFFANDPAKAIKYAGESSRTTHAARECVDACCYFAALIIGAIQGKSKEEILSPRFTPVPGLWEEEPLSAKVAEIADGSFKQTKPPLINGAIQGYVIPSLHAALWAFYHTDNFADGALKIVNLGYDADTYGAIYGQLAGAYYGADSIPQDWLNLLAKRDLIESFADKLYKASLNQ